MCLLVRQNTYTKTEREPLIEKGSWGSKTTITARLIRPHLCRPDSVSSRGGGARAPTAGTRGAVPAVTQLITAEKAFPGETITRSHDRSAADAFETTADPFKVQLKVLSPGDNFDFFTTCAIKESASGFADDGKAAGFNVHCCFCR